MFNLRLEFKPDLLCNGLFILLFSVSLTSLFLGDVQKFYKDYDICLCFDQEDGEFKTKFAFGLRNYLGELKDFSETISEYIFCCTYFSFPRVDLILSLNFSSSPSSNNKASRMLIYFSSPSSFLLFFKLDPSPFCYFFLLP